MAVLQNHEKHHKTHCVLTRVGVGNSSRLRPSALPVSSAIWGVQLCVVFAQRHYMLRRCSKSLYKSFENYADRGWDFFFFFFP